MHCNHSPNFIVQSPPTNMTSAQLKQVEHLLEQYDVVGRTSDLNGFLEEVNALTGWTNNSMPHQNKSPHNYDGFDRDVIRDALAVVYANDFKVYHHFFPNATD